MLKTVLLIMRRASLAQGEVTPQCRLMLMCPEGQTEAVRRVIEAKRKGEIDDFVFYDVSLDYLAASLQSL